MTRLLIPISTIKDRSTIEGSVEPKRLLPHAISAQEVDVQGVLGTTLYNFYLDHLQSDGTFSGLTAIQQTFIDVYVTPMMSCYAEARFLMRGSVNVGAVGLSVTESDKTKPIDLDDAFRLSKTTRADADFYAERAKRFACLQENYADLGQMMQEPLQNLPPAEKVYQSFIYTGPVHCDEHGNKRYYPR